MEKYLSDFERDQLGEVINIGAGNASNALSQLIGRSVTITTPKVSVGRVETIGQTFGDPESIVTTVLTNLMGDISGDLVMIFSGASSLKLAELLTKNPKDDIKNLDDMDRSALREVGNILSGSNVTALSKFLDVNMLQSVPDVASDMLGSVLDALFAEINKESEVALVFGVGFKVEEEHIDGQISFIFNSNATKKILEATKRKIGVQ